MKSDEKRSNFFVRNKLILNTEAPRYTALSQGVSMLERHYYALIFS